MSKCIMLQSTMSNAGKSFLCAALCRIFREDGFTVSPFKSQNMALNSYITKDGLEMGRAQAMQAEAAGEEPSVYMNPILLKPSSDIGSQVIVNGRVLGNMRAAEYFKYKKKLIPEIKKAFEKVSDNHDIVVIEGAGSPVELNLKSDDIVNMGMAEIADAPVLLVGDIDRGGVFAQLLGTLSLLEKNERERVKGLIVNKFRGDISLFDDGVQILEERGKTPVLGVIPYIKCDIEDEDSLSEKLKNKVGGKVDIAVIRLPRISNFTDFDALGQYENVSVRYVNSPEELSSPDMIIIPGSKSVISDMKYIRDNGLAKMIIKKASENTPVFGICGGYQMLGKKISDPVCSEGGGEINGLGLLDAETVFKNNKTQTRTSGTVNADTSLFPALKGARAAGYEIHMGETYANEEPFLISDDGKSDGAYRGNVFGTYIHGIFDGEDVSAAVLSELFKRKGLPFCGRINRSIYKQRQFDILAGEVRKHIDMEKVYEIIDKKY